MVYAGIVVILYVDKKYFMLKKVAISLIIILNYLGFSSCNSSSSPNYGDYTLSSDVAVTAFSLLSNNKILNNLDSVYFSIDLNNARIFNADSLPKGTDISRMQLSITTTGATVAELKFKNKNNVDTVVNYLENPGDSINFANGPVKLHLVAANKESSLDYTIQINVHNMEPDSLYWNLNDRRRLPSQLNEPKAQKTVAINGLVLCLTGNGSQYSVATAANPGESWNTANIKFGFTPDVNSLTATDNSLFILDTAGTLYRSSDMGQSWASCNVTWHHITGGFGNKLLGISRNGDKFYHVTYPASTTAEVADNFPIEGNSQLFIHTTKWTTEPQAITLGGRDSKGKALAETWAYDGTSWANISSRRPIAAKGMILFPYYVCTTDTITWRTSEKSVLVALGGITDADTINRRVYISGDLGFNWKQAGTLMQLPDYIPAMTDAQAFVRNTTMHAARSYSEWETFSPRKLPFWLVTEIPAELSATTATRAIAPITEWDAPYIYIFGGYDNRGNLYDTVWRGAINKLTFKPIQ